MSVALKSTLRQTLTRFPYLSGRLRIEKRRLDPVRSHRAEISKIVKAANRDYHALIAKMPEHAISPSEKRDIEDYARTVWGSRKHAPSLLTYRAFSGEFIKGWVPWSYFNEVVMPSLKQPDLMGAKTTSSRFLPKGTMPDLAYYIRGSWIDVDGHPINSADVVDFLFSEHDEVYVKTEMGGVGSGVFRHTHDSFDLQDLTKLGNLAIQYPLTQHPYFDDLTPNSVATVRVTTVKKFGASAHSVGSYLRTGLGDATVINVTQSIEIPIVNEDGSLGQYGSMSPRSPQWARVEHHPDTNAPLNTLKVPHFKGVREMCERLHDTLPHLTLIGWDVVITPDGTPRIIEINTKAPGINCLQMFGHIPFADLGWENIWRG